MYRLNLSSLAVLLLLVSVHAQKVDSAKDHFEKAFHYLLEEKLDPALGELDQAIQEDGRFAEAYGLRGSIRYLRQEYDLALTDFNKVIELAPDLAGIHEVYQKLSLIHLIKGNYDRALNYADKAIALAPGNSESYNTRGLARRASGDLNGALADFNKSISLDPTNPRPYDGRGNIRSIRNEWKGALADYSKSIELDPNHPAAYVDRAILRYQKGELDAALADYNTVLGLAPTNAKAHLNRGVIQVLTGHIDEGLADLTRGFAIDPNAVENPRKPTFVNTVILLDQFISANQRNPRGYEARAILRSMQRKEKEAEADFQKALSLDSNLKREIEMVRTKLRP